VLISEICDRKELPWTPLRQQKGYVRVTKKELL